MKTEEEVWLPAPKYEGLYEISNMGMVRSLSVRFSSQHIMSLSLNHKGYLIVKLFKDGARRRPKVHRMVAEAFIPNPENLPQVNHKKGIKTDNRASELEWSTGEDNIKHAISIGLIGAGISIVNSETSATYTSKKELCRKERIGWVRLNKILSGDRAGPYKLVQ